MQNLLKNLVVVTSLLAMGAVGTWIALRPQLPRGAGFTDGEQLLAATRTRDELRLARWDAPQPLAALADFGGAHDPALDPASGRLYFAKGESGSEELWQATPAIDGWIARPLTELHSPRRELAPCFHDGWLWFASDRAGGQGGLDLWRAPLAGDRFLAPENVGAPINSPADESDPALRRDGELWFASNRDGGGSGDFDLLFAKGDGVRFALPQFADALQSPYDERAPAFAPDGRQLFFASNRPGGVGGFDLWRALEDSSGFLAPQNLGTPNGAGDESGPTLADDGFTLLFAANRASGTPTTLLRTRTRELFAVPAPRFTLTDFTILLLLALVALLAWLARRWEALDVLWKCMVVSLLLHLLFLWWTRRVDVEAKSPDFGVPGDTFEIRVLGDLMATIARLEDRAHGESIEVASSLPSVQALTRESVVPELAENAPASEQAPLVRSDVAAAAAAPDASERQLAPSTTSDLASAADPLQTVAADYERLSGSASSPQLAANETGAAEPVAVQAATFVATATATADRSAAGAAPRGETAPAERATSTLAAAPAAAARDPLPSTRDRSEGRETTVVATAAPSDRAERGEGREVAAAALPLAPTATRAAGSSTDGNVAGSTATTPRAALTAGSADPAAVAPRNEAPLAGGGAANTTPTLDPGSRRAEGGAREPAARAAAPVALAPVADGAHAMESAATANAPAPTLALGPAATLPGSGSITAAVATPERAALAGPLVEPGEQPTTTSITGSLAADRAAEPGDASAPARMTPSGERERRGDVAPAVAMQAPIETGTTPLRSGELALAPTLAPSARVGRGNAAPATALPTRAKLALGTAGPEIAPMVAALPIPLPAPVAARAADGAAGPIAPATPRLYERRVGEAKTVALREGGGSEATERAVLAGLRYLAKTQNPKGWFGSASDVDLTSKYRDFRIGKSGIALLAFLGAGHTHRSATEFSPNVARLITWLQSRQDSDSGHFGDSEGYSHGIATYALAECYAMTHDDALVPTLEKALDHLLAMQQVGTNDPRKEGGWTYYYHDGPGFDEFPRASISAWQVMALESAKVGGFEVPAESLAAARGYFLNSFDPGFEGFRYTHNPTWVNGGYGTLPASTPASMFALVLLGERDHPSVAAAERFVLDRQPAGYRWRSQDAFVRRGAANLYFWYYSTLALFCRGGTAWREWNGALQQTLLPAQQRDGSFEAIDLYARDYAGDDENDRAYSTAMCVLMLEVYYRYFTPLLGEVGD